MSLRGMFLIMLSVGLLIGVGLQAESSEPAEEVKITDNWEGEIHCTNETCYVCNIKDTGLECGIFEFPERSF